MEREKVTVGYTSVTAGQNPGFQGVHSRDEVGCYKWKRQWNGTFLIYKTSPIVHFNDSWKVKVFEIIQSWLRHLITGSAEPPDSWNSSRVASAGLPFALGQSSSPAQVPALLMYFFPLKVHQCTAFQKYVLICVQMKVLKKLRNHNLPSLITCF